MWIDSLTFNADGLIPAIAQDKDTGQILMMAYQNRKALELTLQTGTAVYFSRSRQALWHKGETSGHTQIVHDIYTDCDGDAVVMVVSQVGGIACHTGRASCFYQKLDKDSQNWQTVSEPLKSAQEIYGDHAKPVSIAKPTAGGVLGELDKILTQRKTADKDSSYVASLYHKGLSKILEKVGEEAVESILAAKEVELAQAKGQDLTDVKADVVYEVADLWFHSLVALSYLQLSSDDILAELARRFGLSGIAEKNARNKGE